MYSSISTFVCDLVEKIVCNEQSVVVKHFNLYLLFLFSVILSNYIPNSDFIPVNLPYVLETFCKYPFTTEVK